jgi:hypothetical protein
MHNLHNPQSINFGTIYTTVSRPLPLWKTLQKLFLSGQIQPTEIQASFAHWSWSSVCLQLSKISNCNVLEVMGKESSHCAMNRKVFLSLFSWLHQIVPAGFVHTPGMKVHQDNETTPPLLLCKLSGSKWCPHLQARQRINKADTVTSVPKGCPGYAA